MESVAVWADGASRGNPGPAAIGAVIKDEQGKLVTRISQRIGITTNNQAEYRAIIAALQEAIRLGAKQVRISLDSQLVVRQISAQYRVRKAELKPLHQQVTQLLSRLEAFTITHIPHQQNTEAHHLANMAFK